jgi:hypothetical protein
VGPCRFALDISGLVIVLICQRYHVEVLNEPVWEESSFNFYSKRGIQITLKERHA